MAFIVKDRVQETSTTAGTGTFTLDGAVIGFKSFSVIGDGNSTYYAITTAGSEFEVGIGTYTASGTTLSRDTVLASSNSNNLVDFAAGAKNVFVTYPAERSIYLNSAATAVTVGKTNTNTTITTDGTADLTLNTNSGTNSGTFTIADGVNGDISITPNGTGSVILDGLKYPRTDGTANQVLKTDGSGNLTFTTLETGLAWQSSIVTASTLTAVANRGYWINTTSNACTVTLPASATVGDTIILVDYARKWGTNAVTINTNGLNFQGNTTPDPVYNTSGQSVQIIYSGATQGWIPISDDDVTLETPQPVTADFLVVAGGGGNQVSQGSARESGSGGGGLRTSYGAVSGGGGSVEGKITLAVGVVYTCTVGAGSGGKGQGGASSISGTGITTITSTGGGSGANFDGDPGGAGGSGGGGWYTGGAGSGTANQGYNGSPGFTGSPYGGTGGGAAGVGGRDTSIGPGLAVSISGASVTYAAGGVSNNFPSTVRNTNGPANSGNGAGGAASGGSGIVVLRLPTSRYSGVTTGSPTITTDGSDTVITFTGTGTYTGA